MAARPPRWRRRLAVLALLSLLAAAAALLYGLALGERLGVRQLDGLRLSRHGLQLDSLRLDRTDAAGARLQLHAHGLRLDWPRDWRDLALPHLGIAELQLDWQPATAAAPRAGAPDALPRLLGALPREVRIERLDARLPCPAGTCRLSGTLHLQHAGRTLLPARLQLALNDGARQLRLDATLSGPAASAQLQARLALDEQALLSLDARLQDDAGTPRLHASLHWPARPSAEWPAYWLAPLLGTEGQARLAALPAPLSVDAEATLGLPAGWRPGDALPASVTLEQGRLQAALPRLNPAGLDLRTLRAELALRGVWQAGAESWLALRDGSRIEATRPTLTAAQLRAERLQLGLAGLRLDWNGGQPPRLHGPLQLQLASLRQAALQTRDWRAVLHLDANPAGQRLTGTLDNGAGLAAALQAERGADGALRAQLRLNDIDFAAGNPLAAGLAAWPAPLAIAAGRLQAGATLRLNPRGALRASAELQLHGVAAQYERSALSGLDAQLKASLRDGRLQVELPALQLASLDPGIVLGPLAARASYQARLDALPAGKLILYQLDAGLFGGRLRARPDALSLARRPLPLRLQVEGLDLAQLLAAYPAEGLAGSGLLDGELPLSLAADGLRIAGGTLRARTPGGVLQLRNPALQRFAADNPALALAVRALDDFRYDRLDGRVDYAAQGQLLLALRLHGRNPALEGGRPVHFSINLEENLPSLLRSLQLSGRVNQAIQRRVQPPLPARP